MILDTELYNKVLLAPIQLGAEELLIISGYATSAMAFHHLKSIEQFSKEIKISLIVGMSSFDGLALSNHRGFQKIATSEYKNLFTCSYIYTPPPVHTKLYIWLKNNSLFKSYIGSANYTQTAFSNKQREALVECHESDVLNYYHSIEKDSIYCDHLDAENLVSIYNDRNYYKQTREVETTESLENNSVAFPFCENMSKIVVSLLGRNGEVQKLGGLNWGQRERRNPNEAYIQLPPEVYKSDFFPLKTIHFTLLTDDFKTLICTRAQKNEFGAAIETPHNNSLIGEYFRNRLGLANGKFVTKEDLLRYGRTDVTFYKIDDENYYMDFSV